MGGKKGKIVSSYWYKKIVYICPFCGYMFTKRTRVYGKKPVDANDLVEYNVVFDFCEGEEK